MEANKLLAAINGKDSHQIRLLVENGAALNRLYVPGVLPLVFAANSGDLEICRFLVTLGACMDDTSDKTVPSPLSNALSCGFNASVRTLIQLGCDVNGRVCADVNSRVCGGVRNRGGSVFKENYSLVHLAVIKHNFDALKMLLEAGADINTPDDFGNTPIHFVCNSRSSLSLRKILEYSKLKDGAISKPDLNAQTSFGETPLMCAVSSQNTDSMFTLLKEKVCVNAENSLGFTALHCAVLSGTEEVLLTLLRAGCTTNMPHWQISPLYLAASHADEFCEILVEFGADPCELFSTNDTLLHVAAGRCRVGLLDFALEAGVSVDAMNHYGQTSLMNAAEKNFVGGVRQLVRHRASMNVRDNNGWTALVHGIRSGSTEVAVYLIIEGSPRNQECYEHAMSNSRVLQFLLLTEASSWKALLVTHKNKLHLNSDNDLLQWWQRTACNSHSLKHICRLAVRRVLAQLLHGHGILDAIEKLPLPGIIRGYLGYKQEAFNIGMNILSDCDTSDDDD